MEGSRVAAIKGLVPLPARRQAWLLRENLRAARERPTIEPRIASFLNGSVGEVVMAIGNTHVGGAEQIALTVARSITETGRRVWFVVTEDPARTLWTDRFEAVSAGVLTLRSTFHQFNIELALSTFLRLSRPTHLILSNTFLAYDALPRLRQDGLATRVVDILHGEGSAGHQNPASYSLPFRHALDHRIAVSHRMKQILVDRCDENPSRVTVIHNGVDVGYFGEPRPLPSGSGSAAFTVAYVGRLSPEKRPAVLVLVADELRRRGRDGLRFVIAGDGPMSTEIARLIEERQLAYSVEQVGCVADAATVLSRVDAVVLPSTTEGFGLVLTEAMAAGAVPVATRVGGIPEVVEDGMTGLLIDDDPDSSVMASRFATAIEDLITHPGKAEVMSRNARERVAHQFSGERMVEAYHRVLRL